MPILIHKRLSGDIIGAAMAVLNELKPGLDEKLYENALVIELTERGHRVNQQKEFKVEYKGRLIGKLVPDLIVDDLVIVDPKVVLSFNDAHLAQMTGYLAITGLQLALLLNFKNATLEWKRIVKEARKITSTDDLKQLSVPKKSGTTADDTDVTDNKQE